MSYRERNANEDESAVQERFLRYSLHGLLPEESCLIADSQLNILSFLRGEDGQPPTIDEQQIFTDTEWSLVLALLAAYPYYCPFAALLQAFTRKSLDRCQRDVRRALEEGNLDALMRPVRNVLSRLRLKTRPFGIEIKSMLETGYMLMPDPKGEWRKQGREQGGQRLQERSL